MASHPPLVVAIWENDLDAVRRLAPAHASRDPDGRTPLMAAAIDAKSDAAKILLAAGADASQQDPAGWSALHFAAQSGSVEVARLLLEHGALVDAVDAHGNSPLWRATFNYKGDGTLIKLLRANGANPKLANHSGKSPANLASAMAKADLSVLLGDVT